MQRLLDKANGFKTRVQSPQEHLECWRVGIGKIAIGFSTVPQFKKHQHKRGQIQLRRIAEVFKEVGQLDRTNLTKDDKRVKLLLKARNQREKEKRTGKSWTLVAGRVVKRDICSTRMVTVEKALVVIVRR